VPMLQVGTAGQIGIAQIVGLLFSTQGPQPGAILIEWNMHDPPGAPGSCGMWDSHFRIGGAIGTNIEPSNCPADDGTSSPASQCTGAWALIHLTSSGNCYMEGVWGWTADHDIDQVNQINVYNSRGFLIESQGPVWLYGTAMEHSVLYQYNLYKAKDIFMGAIQTETPYYQPSAKTPFTNLVSHYADPTNFCTNGPTCNMAYALVITSSSSVYIYSAGLYSFFNVWNQTCLDGQPNCQMNIVSIDTASIGIFMYAFNTYGSVYSLNSDYPYSYAAASQNWFCAGTIANLNWFSGGRGGWDFPNFPIAPGVTSGAKNNNFNVSILFILFLICASFFI